MPFYRLNRRTVALFATALQLARPPIFNKTHKFFQHHRLTSTPPQAISCPDRKQDLWSGVASGNRDRVEPQVKVKRSGIAACP